MRTLPILVLASALLSSTGCGSEAPLEPTYENVLAVFERSCGTTSRSCHGGSRGSANLNFELPLSEGRPITDELVGVAACQYDRLNLVEPGDPEASWLWIKLTGDHDASGRLQFTPAADWDPGIERRADGTYPPSICPSVEDGEITFGYLMPQNVDNPQLLPARELTMIREWILAGAPGPS